MMAKFQIIINEKGSSFLLALFLMFLMSASGLYLLKNKIEIIKIIHNETKQYLCTKEYIGKYTNHINQIDRLNKIIKLIHFAKTTSLFVPGYGTVSYKSFKLIQNSIIRSQDIIHVSYMKYLFQLHKKGCSFTPGLYKTPFEHRGIILKRNASKLAIKRRDEWNIYNLNLKRPLKISHHKNRAFVKEIF